MCPARHFKREHRPSGQLTGGAFPFTVVRPSAKAFLDQSATDNSRLCASGELMERSRIFAKAASVRPSRGSQSTNSRLGDQASPLFRIVGPAPSEHVVDRHG